MAEPFTGAELLARYPDPEFQAQMFELFQLDALLTECIIDNSYKVPQSLFQPIALTDYGNEFYRQLRRRNISHADAMLSCLLEFCHMDLLIDVEKTSRDALTESIGEQIKSDALIYPFVFGRTLYDKYADLFLDQERSFLTLNETKQLLRDTPQGVFQTLDLITGPFGILHSKSDRFIYPRRDLWLRHCYDLSCNRVHSVSLSTSRDASINEQRKTVRDVLKHENEQGSDWAKLFRKIAADRVPTYKDITFDPIVVLIGDSLADEELHSLLASLIDDSADVRSVASGLQLKGSGKNIAQQLDRAQIMQLILTASDSDIYTAIDILVRRGIIAIPRGEVRQPVINRYSTFGRYGLRAELGEFGVRVQASSTNIAALRARRLVEEMYDLDALQDRQELEWQFRSEPGTSLEAKLEHYLQHKDPLEALRNLVLIRRSNVIVAVEKLGLIDGSDDNDDYLLSAIAWKLGFSVVEPNEKHSRFWKLQHRMLQQTRESPIGKSDAELEELRGVAANYFTELESVLDDSLAFVTWALTNDHYASSKPFVYRPEADRKVAFELLSLVGRQQRPTSLSYSDRNTLFPLIRGFKLLAAILSDYEGRSAEFERSEDQYPPWRGAQSLQRFPFVHSIPFLDLVQESRDSIRSYLNQVSEALVSADISDARNEWLHGRRTSSDLDRLRLGLEKVADAIRLVEESGFSRQRYSWLRDEIDGQGRRTSILGNANGRQLALFRPSPFTWLGLPTLSGSWYVMHSARFAEPSEVLRFGVELESAFARLWSNYPRRPAAERLGRAVAGLGTAEDLGGSGG